MATWIFQSNPKKWPVAFDEIADEDQGKWTANQRAKEMRPGDRVYFWCSGADRGIYCVGTLLTTAYSDPEFDGLAVGVSYDLKLFDRPWLVPDLKERGLGDLLIIRAPDRPTTSSRKSTPRLWTASSSQWRPLAICPQRTSAVRRHRKR